MKAPLADRHPNSPLAEVIFEIRYPGETAIEGRRHEFQDKIRDDFPDLFVPLPQAREASALQPYRFEGKNSGVAIGINRFAYFSWNYQGFEVFKAESLRLVGIFAALFPVRRLTRIGLRHLNIIPFVRENGLIPIDSITTLGDPFVKIVSSLPAQFSTSFVAPGRSGRGSITARLESVTKEDQHEALKLDFDYSLTGDDLHIDRTEDYLSEAHRASNDLFERLITEQYFEFIKGSEL